MLDMRWYFLNVELVELNDMMEPNIVEYDVASYKMILLDKM